jgi:hypothetical protein
MGQRILHGDLAQLGAGPSPERPAAGGEEEAGDPVRPAGGVGVDALVYGGVLAVDGDQLGTGRGSRSLDDRPAGDERLLVRQRQAASGLERSHGDPEPGKSHDRVHHRVGIRRHLGEGVGADHELRAPRGQPSKLAEAGFVPQGDHQGAELGRLPREGPDRRPRPECDQLEAVRVGPHDVERLGADRARRPEDGDGSHEPASGLARR